MESFSILSFFPPTTSLFRRRVKTALSGPNVNSCSLLSEKFPLGLSSFFDNDGRCACFVTSDPARPRMRHRVGGAVSATPQKQIHDHLVHQREGFTLDHAFCFRLMFGETPTPRWFLLSLNPDGRAHILTLYNFFETEAIP